MARRRFFVDTIHRGHARIEGPDAHHLTRVLRVEPGHKYEISDNQHVYLAEVSEARKDIVDFAILEQIAAAPPVVHLSLLASIIKFERFEWLIEKATELGVERIKPVEADRSEKGLANAVEKRITRWNRIAREASEQSSRDHLPEILAPVGLDAARVSGYGYLLDEASAAPILGAVPSVRSADDHVAVLVGPEGGWTDRERAMILAAGWTAVSQGPTILRAETAAIAALATLSAAWQK